MKNRINILLILAVFLISSCSKERVSSLVIMDKTEINILINNQSLPISLESNISVDYLLSILDEKTLTLTLSDYGGFEKVGNLGLTLPSEDHYMKTNYGDVVLYNSSQLVIFYNSNQWSYTKIGRIEGLTQNELITLLGKGDVNIMLYK